MNLNFLLKRRWRLDETASPRRRRRDPTRAVPRPRRATQGSFAIYLEPWHADIETWLDLKKNHGNELERARDLFYGLWIPDLFMRRVEANEQWSLMCPNECPGLADCHGKEFEELYEKYEKEGRARKQIPAQQLWFAILDSQVETGTPYMLYKDACNGKSNQKHLGTIKSSNLCTEIVEYTSPDEVAVCNLASINLTAMVTDDAFDFKKLRKISNVVTRNLNKVIDVNYYPVRSRRPVTFRRPHAIEARRLRERSSWVVSGPNLSRFGPRRGVVACQRVCGRVDGAPVARDRRAQVQEAENSNMRHRPIGIGVQGLADALVKLRLPYEGDAARQLNKDIFETIYYGAVRRPIHFTMTTRLVSKNDGRGCFFCGFRP